MPPRNNKYDLKSLGIAVLLVVVGTVVFFFYWDTTKHIMRYALEWKLTYALIWIVTVVIFIHHYFRLRKKEVQSKPIFTKQYGDFADNAFGGFVYATAITTALTLLKGLFIQIFFNDKQYFAEFDNLDLATIFVLMLFLLYYSLMKVVDVAKETYLAEHTEQVKVESGPAVNRDQQTKAENYVKTKKKKKSSRSS